MKRARTQTKLSNTPSLHNLFFYLLRNISAAIFANWGILLHNDVHRKINFRTAHSPLHVNGKKTKIHTLFAVYTVYI